MSRRPLRQPIPLRRSSSLCTERGSILSSFSRSNSLTSNSATVGLPSLGFPARTESPVEHPTGLAYPWPQTQWINRTPQEGDMGPLIVPIRPDSCPPDPHAFGANFRAMNMMAYPRVASSTSSGSDSDSDYAPGIASEPALDSARRNAMVLDSDQLDMAFQQLHTSNETGKPWLDKSQVSYHGKYGSQWRKNVILTFLYFWGFVCPIFFYHQDGRGVHGVRHSHRRQGFESRSKNVRFAEDTQPVNAEPPLKPVDNNQQAWYHHVLGAPREHSIWSETSIHPINTVLNHRNVSRPGADNLNTNNGAVTYDQRPYHPPASGRSMTSNVPNNGAPQFNSINTNRPLLSVNTRTKKQVRISPVVDFAPTSLPHSQEAERPSSPSGYSSISESIAEPQTPPSDICMVHIPVASEDVMLPSAQVRYGEEISRQMSINEIIARLVKHGCRNLIGQLDLATFGQFPIANGGFSDVYRGYLRTGQRVAIKSLRVDAQSLSQNPTHLKHAARELHTWCKCNHPNVLQLLGLATFRDRIGMVSPWMSEGSVPQYLRRAPGVNKIHICAQIANGLAYMHGIGIAHGDVKGSNVLVSSDGVPALTDFGNSHLQERTLGFTQSTNGGAMTLRWSAPEVIKDSCTHDKAADIYALGMTILEVLTGEQPYYYIRSESSVMLRVVNNKEHPLRPEVIPINSRDGNRLWDLLVACWSYKPEARPSGEVVSNTFTFEIICGFRPLASLVSVTQNLGSIIGWGLELDFDDDDYTSAATPFGRSAPQQLGRASPTPSHPFGDHGQSAALPFPAQDVGSLPGSSLLSAAPINTSSSGGGGGSSGGMFTTSNGSGIFAPPGHTRGESDTSLQSFRYDPPPRAKRKGSFASLKAAFKGTNAKSALPVPKNTISGSHSQSRRPSASATSSRVGMRSMHSTAPSYAASEFSDGGAGNSSFTGFGGYNGFTITTGPADEEIPPVPQLPSRQTQSSASRDLSSSGGFKFGGMRPRNISTSGTSQAGGSTADFSQNVAIPRPPRRATRAYEDGDTAPDPKTPAEYALHAVFIRFVTEVEQKTSAFLKEPLHSEPLLSTLLGPGADRQFDATLDSLAHIALKHTRLVIDALARWRRTQRLIPSSAQIRVHTQRHQLGHGPTHSDATSNSNLNATLGALNPGGSTQAGSGYGSYVYSQSEVTKVLAERMELMTVYVLSRALLVVLAIVSELGKDVLGEGMGASLEENSFEPVRNPDLKRLALSGNHRANAELYASLLGQIANIRFQSVTDRYLRELEPVAAGQVPRDHDARYEHVVQGLKHIRIKVWPPEAFEEGAEFMEMLSKSFVNAHGTRLKIAFAKSLVEILHPIGKTAQAEVNHPGWAKAIDLIYPKAREMISKPRYFAVAYPLVISALCVAPQDFFAKNWMSCIDLSVAKMKQEKQSRVMCLNGILRIIWTYLYRCHEPSSTTTSKLDIVLKHLFPPKGLSIFPPDESLECHEYIMHFILSRHFDYGADLVMEFLQESEALGNGTLDLTLPFRPIIALRAILLTLTAMQKDSKPAWPSSVDFTTYDTQDDYTFEATFLPESFYTKPGVTTFFERCGPVVGKLAMACAQTVGHLILSDERFLRTNYSFEEGEQLVFKRRGELSVAYPRHLDPQVYFLMVCFESWPRCLHPSISLIEALDLLIKSLNHVDAGLAEAASSALRRIAADEQHVKAAVWRCTRYLFSPPIQPGNRDTSALRITSEQEYAVPLWADLVEAWAEQLEKPTNDETNDSDLVKVNSGELAQDVEGGALCLLSSVSQPLRALATKILLLSVKLIPNAQKRSSGSQASPTNPETRVCNILLGKGVSISTIFERREHAPPEKYRRKFLQWQQNKDPNCLLRLAQSKDEEDLRVWTYVFPAITQECMVRCPHALEYARMAWNAWIVRFHPIMSTIAGISSKVATATPLARPTRQGSGASEEVEDRRDGHGLFVEQWRCWIIALCSCATQSDTRPTPAREHGRVPSDPASQRERLTTARGLFRLIIPFLSSDQARFRDAVTTALGSVHLSTFKTVLEDLQSITRHIYDEFRSTAANRSSQTARRARSQDRLYVAVAQVHQLTAHFLRDPKSLSDQGALHFMLQFVRETKTFLSHSDINQDCDSHRLRRLFCGVVENLFDALSNRKDIDRFMWPHARLELFRLCQEWCVYGPASGPVRQRHAAMRANAARYGTVALYDSECEQLVEAVPAALASLCAGAFFYVDKTIRSPGKHVHPDGPTPLAVQDVLDWINASLEHPSESVNASARKALKSLLTYPARNEELLDEICRRAFASLHTMPGSTPSFGVVADVILTCTDSPFTFSQVVCLALASLGDTDHQIRRHGFDVLEATHRQTSRIPFIAESEAAIRSYAPSVYLPGQRRISEFLATNHPGEAVPLLAQCALHLSHLREGEALVLHALEPWMAHVELMADATNDLLPAGDLCMHNLLALTIRFGDTHPSEIQALWTKLVAGTYSMNHHAIVKWLIEQATWLGNAAFVAYSRRVVAYLSRTQFGELVFHELCTLISPATMSIQKANMPKRPRSHLYTADLSTLLPLSESRKQLSVAQLALLFLGDVALDPTWDISYQLPIFLHAIFLQTDHKSASVEQEIHHLLLQTLRTCTAAYEDNGFGGLSREDVKSSIARLADQNNEAFWLSNESGILDMEKLCFEVLRLLEPSRPRLRQEWGLLALEWGAHSSDASTASRSLQLLRILRPRVQQGALNELLARLTNTVASNDSGPQKVCQDVLMSLTALVKADVLDHTLWPQLFWCARACLSTTVEAEYAQALILLKTLLQVLDITRDEVIEDLLDHQPESWDEDDISLQAVLLPGLRSSLTWKDAMEVLKSLSRCTHDQFVDPSAGRLRSLYTVCLPPFLEAMDQSQLDEDLAELATNIARMADNEKRVGISRLMTSFAKQKFRTKEDFLRQAVSCLRENYTSKHSTETLTLLLGLVLNSERWLRVRSMQLLKLLFQHVETKNQNVLSELLMPLLSLLRTDLALQALDVLDEPLSVSGGLAATHVLRMSMHIRSSRELEGNLVVFGVPEPSGWCVPRPLEMAALCRRNIQALYESLSATASARPITMAFSVALDSIPANGMDQFEEFGAAAEGMDDDLGNLVSQLNDLNSFFTVEGAFPEPITVSPVPPSVPITFQNEAERRVAAILSRSLAKSGTRGDSISSMEGTDHNSDRERGGDKGPGTPYIGLFEMSTPHRDGVDRSRGDGNGDLRDGGGHGLHARGYLSDSDGEEAGYEADSYLSPSQSHNHTTPLDEIVGTSYPSSSFTSVSREDTPVAQFGGSSHYEHGPDSDVESDEDRKEAFGLESPRQKLNANRRSSGGLRSLFGVGGSNHNSKEGESRAMAAFGGTVNMSMNVTSARTNQRFDRRKRI